jgi:hypothetical protein
MNDLASLEDVSEYLQRKKIKENKEDSMRENQIYLIVG